MAYAHAVIEVPVDADDPGKGVTRYNRGDTVPDDLPGIEELVEAGSVRDDEYDPTEEPTQAPEFIEIDGVRYIKTGDGASTEEQSNA